MAKRHSSTNKSSEKQITYWRYSQSNGNAKKHDGLNLSYYLKEKKIFVLILFDIMILIVFYFCSNISQKLLIIIIEAIALMILIITPIILLLKYALKDSNKPWHSLAIAGTVVLVTGELFGSLFGAIFPVVLGPNLSDFTISCDPLHHAITMDLLNNYRTNPDDFIYNYSKISVNNLHPIQSYTGQVYLKAYSPLFFAEISDPVVNVGQSTDIRISTTKRLDPGKYQVDIQGIGSDGRKRNCTITITIVNKGTARTCNECSSLGQRKCFGNNSYRTCGFFDPNRECLIWSPPQYCDNDERCNNGACIKVIS